MRLPSSIIIITNNRHHLYFHHLYFPHFLPISFPNDLALLSHCLREGGCVGTVTEGTCSLLEPPSILNFPDSFQLVKILGEMRIQLYSGKTSNFNFIVGVYVLRTFIVLHRMHAWCPWISE